MDSKSTELTKREEINEVVECCLLAGKLMLQSGAETYRVEDTMMRIAATYGFENSHSYVTPTGIIFAVDQMEATRIIRITERSTDLQKVTLVNSVSRSIASREITLQQANEELQKIESTTHAYPIFIQIAAAAISSACFLIMFKGGWYDFLSALVTGGLGFVFFIYVNRVVNIKFFSEFLTSFLIGLLAVIFVKTGMGQELDKIIIGSVMPLVPGLLITNAVRDLMVGHLVSGLSKGAEAFLTAFAIGAGVAVVITFY
ncbi:threonine/serine exporter family protein [Schinkia azotoformans]|nr:threonine/serine exporter family protein [Schinkia azotoformans]MEC1714394.1 threonine/serine exporter family protein [Schinkia azotoformans]MEC1741191.1 threonine/serine exporter family protein [Schinkia azotoformans]MEC1744042.1 threonine/serine exporter family protein [Schinkia azotoformans]MEC1757232.1 threonine/serine exporter family protein [Schinkia azotoformans]MEC1768396.1 threonine/serine exporter family protein [Schinkia azotoformans]